MLFAQEQQVTQADLFSSTATGWYNSTNALMTASPAAMGMLRLGSRAQTRDGRVFRFVRCGAVSTVAGSLYQASAPLPNHLGMTTAAAAIGATSVTVTPGATAWTQNQYAEGWLQVDTTPGNGYLYGINSHLANAGSVATAVILEKDDAIVVALTSASKTGMIANPYADIIVTPTTPTAAVVGVAVSVITNAQYGWIQTWGPVAALINGTPAITAPVLPSVTTAGALDVWTAAAQPVATLVGNMMQVGVSGKNNSVFLRLAS